MSGRLGVFESGETYLVVRTRPLVACFLHWVLFLSIVVLTITGYYIGDPEFYYGQGEAYQAFAMAEMRLYHLYASWAMAFVLVSRFYLAFTESCNHDIKQFLPTPKNIVNAVKLAIYFVTLRGEGAHYRFINPLGGIGIFMMAVFMLTQTITGISLYSAGTGAGSLWWVLGSPIDSLLEGQQNVRLIHHLVMYFLMFVILIHVYMQVWKNSVFTESDISSIIAGYKIFPLSQIGHFADYYGLRLTEDAPAKKRMDEVSTAREKDE